MMGGCTPACYMLVAPLAAMKDRGELAQAWWLWKAFGRAALLIGWPGDVFFWNLLIGSIIFRELPRETTFSSRIERHAREGDLRGLRWAVRLNRVWPGHINYK